jgi:L-serine kinase (ADP)
MTPARARRQTPHPAPGGTSPSSSVTFELVELDRLLPHEEIDGKAFEELVRALEDEGSVREPILVARGHGVVLNGHHRFAAFKAMGLRRAPAWVVDYFSDVVDLEKWPDSPFPGPVTKEEVVRRAKTGALYPPKTTRHRLKVTPEARRTPLSDLR